MKKLYLYIFIILIACGCSKQDEAIIGNDTPIVGKSFSVKTEDVRQGETKAHIGEGLKVVFDDPDELAVFDKNTAPSQYIYSAETQKFSGESVATGTQINDVLAFYPYSANVTCDGTKIESSFPAVQKYEENSFSNNSHIMFGITDDVENGITLKNMCGYIKLKLYATEQTVVKEILLSSLDNTQVVSGDFYISKEDEEIEHSLKMYAIDADGHTKQSGSVTLDCSAQDGGGIALSNDSNDPTIFYIAVPAQKYTKGFKITVTDIYGREITRSASSEFTLERSHIKPMAALGINMNSVISIETDANGNAYVTAEANAENIFPIEKFLKWGYLVNYCNNELGIELTGNVYMPQYEIEPDHVNKTYKITDTPITVTDGIPSGSNWVPLRMYETAESKYFNGIVDGGNYRIEGLCINTNTVAGGFIGWMNKGAKLQNLTFNQARVYNLGGNVGESYTGIAVGRSQNNTTVNNVHVTKSSVTGTTRVGGIVGYNYRRIKTGIDEKLAIVSNCTTDEDTSISGSSSEVGGICGNSYGAAIIRCVNNADVTGSSNVGGIAGHHREYYKTHVNSYIIECISSEKATITAKATNGIAGGLLGYSTSDRSGHPLAISYVVGSYSLSEVSANTAGSLIGHTHTDNCHIIASWAKKVADNVIGAGSHTNISTDHFASTSDINQDFVTQMNTTIEEYNENVKDEEGSAVADIIKCHYKWQYNAGSWPTLVEVVEP